MPFAIHFLDIAKTAQYVGGKNLHWSERIWWIVSIIISVIMCAYFIHKMFLKITPMVITFDSEYTPISEIPFPTVTLCNPIIVTPSTLNYTDISQQIWDKNYTIPLKNEVIQQMYSASFFCDYDSIIRKYIKRNNITIDRNIWPYLKEISPEMLTNRIKGFIANKVSPRS